MKVKIEKNQRTLILLIIFTIFIICIYMGIRKKQELTEPVYLRHLVQHYLPAIADSVLATSTINLMYIADSKVECQIINVSFDGHPELKVMAYNTSSYKYGPYYLNFVSIFNQPKIIDLKNYREIRKYLKVRGVI